MTTCELSRLNRIDLLVLRLCAACCTCCGVIAPDPILFIFIPEPLAKFVNDPLGVDG